MFNGSGVALITPFCESGVNFDTLGKLIDFQITGGTDALFVLGTTGEPSTMTDKEKESVVEFTLARVNKKIPVFTGSGANSTLEAVKYSKRYADMGADGLLVVTPYYNKCTQNGAVAHYAAISDSVNIPVVAYNVPARTGFNMLPATLVKLCSVKNVRAVKEASGDISQILETIRLTGNKLAVYSGDDLLTVAAISLGAKGVVSVAANIVPGLIHEMARAALDNNFSKAAKIQLNTAELVKALFCEVNPIPAKKAAQFLGFDAGLPRLPLTEMEPANAEILKAAMVKLGLKINGGAV